MPGFSFRAGDELTLWVKDRSNLPAFYGANALQKSLAQVGVSCSLRGFAGLPEFSLSLTQGGHREGIDPFVGDDPDAYRIAVGEQSGVSLVALGRRGLTFAVWDLLERLGWSWPTPSLERSPKAVTWELEEGVHTAAPAMRHRIVFLEEVQVTPDILGWLSRQRINTLFPSNPARFTDPEVQFSDDCMTRARELGFDFIIGGDWWEWLGSDLAGVDPVSEIADRILELWDEMDDPPPRLSLWPVESRPELHRQLLETLLARRESLCVESSLVAPPDGIPADRVLLRASEDGFDRANTIEGCMDRLGELTRVDSSGAPIYLASNAFSEEGRLGHSIAPFLWPRLLSGVKAAAVAGFSGASIGFKSLPLERFLETAGFAVALVARGMWHGPAWEEGAAAKKMYFDQFDTAGGVVGRLVEDLSEWMRGTEGADGKGAGGKRFPFRSAVDLLQSERRRDQLDERISEIEESPPSEPCLEMIRALSTLVSLYDLENTADIHEAAATARTLWRRNDIDNWPEWLKRDSPLVELLKPLLRTSPTSQEEESPGPHPSESVSRE